MYLVKKDLPKEAKNIEIEIKISLYIERAKKEIHKIHRYLYLKSGDLECEIKIEMNIFIIPFEILLSKYKLEYNKENEEYFLLADKLLYGEELIFEIQNYNSSINPLKVFPRIESFEKCTCPQPNIDFIENKLKEGEFKQT